MFPSTSFPHVPWKNWEKWNHFCEGPGWTQSQHCAQYTPFSVSSRVHDSRCGCKCNALRWRLDWEVEGNVLFIPHPVCLIFVDNSWRDYLERSITKFHKRSATFCLICIFENRNLCRVRIFFFEHLIMGEKYFKPMCIYLSCCPNQWHQFLCILALFASKAKWLLNILYFLNQLVIYWYEVL